MVKFKYDAENEKVPVDVTELFINVTEIPKKIFHRLGSLKRVILSDKVTTIGDRAFEGCQSLTEIEFSGKGLRSIGEDAFHSCENLKLMMLPHGLKDIGSAAFMSCNSLRALLIPDSVEELGQFAFRECTSLSFVLVPGSVRRISDSAFFGCKNLRSVVLSEGIEEIGDFAFASNTKLAIIEIPESVDEIHEHCFYDCDALDGSAGDEEVSELVRNRFEKLPLHRLLYQRYFMDGSAQVLKELKEIYEDDSNANKKKDVFGYDANDIVRYTSTPSSAIDDDAILKWLDNPSVGTNNNGRRRFSKSGKSFYESTFKQDRIAARNRDTAKNNVSFEDDFEKAPDDKDLYGEEFKKNLLREDIFKGSMDSGLSNDKELYGDEFKKNLMHQDVIKAETDASSTPKSRKTSKTRNTGKSYSKPAAITTNSDVFSTSKLRGEVPIYNQSDKSKKSKESKGKVNDIASTDNDASTFIRREQDIDISREAFPKDKDMYGHEFKQSLLQQEIFKRDIDSGFSINEERYDQSKEDSPGKNGLESNLRNGTINETSNLQDNFSKNFSGESMLDEIMSGLGQSGEGFAQTSGDSMQKQTNVRKDDSRIISTNDDISKRSSRKNGLSRRDNQASDKYATESALSRDIRRHQRAFSGKPIKKQNIASSSGTYNKKHDHALSTSRMRDEVPLFYDATKPMQKPNKNRTRFAQSTGEVHLTFLPHHDHPDVRRNNKKKMTLKKDRYYGKLQSIIDDDSKKQRLRGNPHMDV